MNYMVFNSKMEVFYMYIFARFYFFFFLKIRLVDKKTILKIKYLAQYRSFLFLFLLR